MAHMLNVPWTSFPAGWSLVGSEALRLPQEPIFKGKEMDAGSKLVLDQGFQRTL